MMDRKSWSWAMSGGGRPRDDYMHRAMREVAEAMAQRQRQRATSPDAGDGTDGDEEEVSSGRS